MGCLSSSPSIPVRSISKEAQPINSGKITSLKLEQVNEFSFNIQTPPLVNGDEVIFLYSHKNTIKYSIFDLNTSQFTKKKQEFKCDDSELFDPFDSVYTLNPQNSKIYFVTNNKDIKTLDLNTNQLETLNKSITTTNKNFANIACYNNKVYIFGAEEKSDASDQYTLVPYTSCAKAVANGKTMELIRNFGSHSTMITTQENGQYLLNIMGGETTVPSKQGPMHVPSGAIWRYNMDTNEWANQRHLVGALHSFGIINYENKYLISFGGELKSKHNIEPTRVICVLALQAKDEYGLEQHYWNEVAKLPQSMDCYYVHCVYDKGSEVVHLFCYDGKYFKVEIKDIFDRLSGGRKKNVWTEAGKTAVPTKSKRIQSMGPKKGDVDSSDEED